MRQSDTLPDVKIHINWMVSVLKPLQTPVRAIFPFARVITRRNDGIAVECRLIKFHTTEVYSPPPRIRSPCIRTVYIRHPFPYSDQVSHPHLLRINFRPATVSSRTNSLQIFET